MKVLYATVKFNEGSYKSYTYMTIEKDLKVGDTVVVQSRGVAYFSEYVDEPDFNCKWIIGRINLSDMTTDLNCKLYNNGINFNTGKSFVSKDSKDWEQEIEKTYYVMF